MNLQRATYRPRPEPDPEPEPYKLGNVLDTQLTLNDWLRIGKWIVGISVGITYLIGTALLEGWLR